MTDKQRIIEKIDKYIHIFKLINIGILPCSAREIFREYFHVPSAGATYSEDPPQNGKRVYLSVKDEKKELLPEVFVDFLRDLNEKNKFLPDPIESADLSEFSVRSQGGPSSIPQGRA